MLALQEGEATMTTVRRLDTHACGAWFSERGPVDAPVPRTCGSRDRQRGRRSEMALVFGAGFAVGAAVATAVVLAACHAGPCYDDPLMHLLDPDGEARDGR